MHCERKLRKTTHLCLALAVAIYLCFNALPAAQGFIAVGHLNPRSRENMNNLTSRVHKDQWVIGYSYMDNCSPKKRNNGEAIEEAITVALRAWLQPVRDLNTGKPVVDDFRYVPNPVVKDVAELQFYDLRINIFCHFGISTGGGLLVNMRRGAVVNRAFGSVLLHEIGHNFGLGDTYIKPWLTLEELRVSRGGLGGTIGHQPSSVMSGLNTPFPFPPYISQDDANGIVWLYKFYHENLPLEDCIFPAYELEKDPHGCRPKYPLIFEIQHGTESLAGGVINRDENIDINAKDETGFTALDYALAKGYNDLVGRIVSHPGFDVNARNIEGSTALLWAVKRGDYGVTERLLRHHAIDVNIRDTDGTAPLKAASTQGHNRIVKLLLKQKQDATDWTPVTKDSPPHHRSVFYLLHQPGSDPPQVFHAGYLGTLPDGSALFAAQKGSDDSIEKSVKGGNFSLVGYQGLVSSAINVRVLASFGGRNEETGNVLVSVRGADLSGYEPLELGVYPSSTETEVELLTYKFGGDIMLDRQYVPKALGLPLRSRSCVSVPDMELAGMDLGQHTCGPANSVAVGSLLFDKANQMLIGFYRAQSSGLILGDGLPIVDVVSGELIRLVDAKSVRPKNTVATLWAVLKAK